MQDNSEIVKLQNTDKSSPDYGGIMCPRCGLYHTRAGDKSRLNQALILADWLMGQQLEDGSWNETPITWKATSTDQVMMMLLTYPIVETKLKKADRKRWMDSMKKGADWLVENINIRDQVMNYPSSTAGTLAQAYLLFGEEKYKEKARELAHLATAKMNAEWFIEAAKKSAASHFSFIYPDGMMEASAGVRSNKWSIFGSGTSDGCAVMLAMQFLKEL